MLEGPKVIPGLGQRTHWGPGQSHLQMWLGEVPAAVCDLLDMGLPGPGKPTEGLEPPGPAGVCKQCLV